MREVALSMIGRVWHGWTTRGNAPAYEALLCTKVLPSIAARGILGYRGAHVLKREGGEEVEFVTLLWFDSIEAVRAFAGEDHEIAVVPENARKLLIRFDARSRHYETLLTPSDPLV